LDDRFQLGSCTKAMTALLICRLVDAANSISMTTLGDALPDVKMRDDYRRLTIAQLLTFPRHSAVHAHRTQDDTESCSKPVPFGTAQAFVEHVLQEEPVVSRGPHEVFERQLRVGRFRSLAKDRGQNTRSWWHNMFKPLSMTTAGFAATATKERPNNRRITQGRRSPTRLCRKGNGRRSRFSHRRVAAAAVRSRDFGRFAMQRLSAARGKDPLLKLATAARAREALRREGPRAGDHGEPRGCTLQ